MPSTEGSPQYVPQNLEVEQALLGAAIINPEAMTMVDDVVVSADFFDPLHSFLWDAMTRMWAKGRRPDVKLLSGVIEAAADKRIAGGMPVSTYIARLASEATTVINARDYAATIRDLSDQRRMMIIGTQLRQENHYDVAEVAADAIEQLDSIISTRVNTGTPGLEMKDAVVRAIDETAKAYARDGALSGITWGLKDMDSRTLGIHKGELLVLAGRPGMGKTAVALGVARSAAKIGYNVLIESLEMTDTPLVQRMIADEMFGFNDPISYWKLRSGRITEDEFYRMTEAAKLIAALPIRIEQTPGQTLSQIGARARQRKRRKGLDLLIVDHMQLVKPSDRYKGNRVNEIGEVSGGLKGLAKELGIAVMALCQLSRAVESRDEKRPNLSDLRASGDIEQDADAVVMVFREAYYLARNEPAAGTPEMEKWTTKMEQTINLLELIIEKQRSGPIGRIQAFCNIGANAVRDYRKEEFLPRDYTPPVKI